jgi:GT2 family glycosyltransferase
MKKVALVTVDFNGHKDTLELLETLKKVDFKGFDYRIFAIDKTPGDWLGNHLKENIQNLELIQAGVDKGFAGGYNFGMRFAMAWGADYIMIINNDTLVGDNGLVKKLIKVLEDHADACVVSPKIYFAPGFEFYKDKYQSKQQGKVLWYAGGTFDWANVRSVHRGIDEVDTGKYDQTEVVGFVSGCCLMVRRETLETFGYFDEELFAYFEDNDWQQRILLGGGTLYYCGSTNIYHKVSQTMGVGSPQTDYLLTRNRLYFTEKYASLRTKFAVLREMFKQLMVGRPAQKLAIVDYLDGKKGPSPYFKKSDLPYTYPIRFSIVISVYKASALADQLLKSIFNPKSGFNPKLDEVIVLDNATDDDCDSVVKKYPLVKYLKNAVNKGFVGGYNRLMEYTRGEMILMLNADMELKSGALTSLAKTSKEFNHEAILSGQLLFPDGGPQDSCFHLPTITGAINEYIFKKKGSYFMFRPEVDHPVRVEGAVMACFLIPQKIINRMGYLNRKLFMYFEDIDYCRRAKEYGVPIYYCPDAKFYHHHGASAKKMGKVVINKQIIESSKIYHGKFYYALLTATLWLVQKINLVTTPVSKWEKESNP